MNELTLPEFPRVLPLLVGIQQAVLPYAICEGTNPGRIFVDQREKPHAALIWTPVGYYFLAGEPAHAESIEKIGQVLAEIFVPASQAGGESGFL